jgi:hypothetical protein
MGIRVFNNLPPHIKDISHNPRKFEIFFLNIFFIHIIFIPLTNIFNIRPSQTNDIPKEFIVTKF